MNTRSIFFLLLIICTAIAASSISLSSSLSSSTPQACICKENNCTCCFNNNNENNKNNDNNSEICTYLTTANGNFAVNTYIGEEMYIDIQDSGFIYEEPTCYSNSLNGVCFNMMPIDCESEFVVGTIGITASFPPFPLGQVVSQVFSYKLTNASCDAPLKEIEKEKEIERETQRETAKVAGQPCECAKNGCNCSNSTCVCCSLSSDVCLILEYENTDDMNLWLYSGVQLEGSIFMDASSIFKDSDVYAVQQLCAMAPIVSKEYIGCIVITRTSQYVVPFIGDVMYVELPNGTPQYMGNLYYAGNN